jgi:similar to spore coat protein
MKQEGTLSEKEIAFDLILSSKAEIATLAKVLTETTNTKLRVTLKSELTSCINSHYRLSDIVINKEWCNAYGNPQQQLKQDLSAINSVIKQND